MEDCKEGDIKTTHKSASRHTPVSEPNKIKRLEWVIHFHEGETPLTKTHYYPMFDFVHLNEKWFYLTKKPQRCFLAKGEEPQYRATLTRKDVPKVMFITIVARPVDNNEWECIFDRKIGTFSFIYKDEAK